MVHHHPEHENKDLACEKCEKDSSFAYYLVAGAILIAAILVSASLFYNTKRILNKLDDKSLAASLSPTPSQAGQNQVQPQPANPAQPGGIVNVAERKDAAVLGNKNAKVTIYEFSDFQCPFCKRFFDDTFSALKKQYIDTGKVKLVYRHFPLDFHQNAQKAGEAAECANAQGKFWAYHDLLFKNSQGDGTNLDTASLKKYADSLGLNSGTLGFGSNKFNQCLDNGETAEIVKKDTADGSSYGVSGTPTFFVNGVKLVGAKPIANFEKAIEEALKK